jgi:hypothetical protein
MTTDKIKDQIISYCRQFKQNSGHLMSFEIVFNYINFLKTEPFLNEMLSPIFAYVDRQMAIIAEMAKDPQKSQEMDNISFDLLKPANFSNVPVFNQEFKGWQKNIQNKENISIMTGLSVYLMNLVLVASSIQEIKDCQKAGNSERVKELIEAIKDESFSVVASDNIKGIKPTIFTSAQYIDSSMELVSKYIIDNIDAQTLLSGDKPLMPVSFDKEKSILYIRGQEIKIMLKNDKPLDHYILEAIFAKEDLTEQTDFVEIAEDIIKEDYNGNWQRYRHACDKLNQKITKATSNKINGFIEYSTGKTGWCKINQKYL